MDTENYYNAACVIAQRGILTLFDGDPLTKRHKRDACFSEAARTFGKQSWKPRINR